MSPSQSPRPKAGQKQRKAASGAAPDLVQLPTGKRKRPEGDLKDRADWFSKRRGSS